MENTTVFQEPQQTPGAPVEGSGKKPLDVAALVLGIVAIVAAPFIPLVSYVCGIIGLVLAIRHRKAKRTTVALILCIIGIVGGLVSNIIAAVQIASQLQSIIG